MTRAYLLGRDLINGFQEVEQKPLYAEFDQRVAGLPMKTVTALDFTDDIILEIPSVDSLALALRQATDLKYKKRFYFAVLGHRCMQIYEQNRDANYLNAGFEIHGYMRQAFLTDATDKEIAEVSDSVKYGREGREVRDEKTAPYKKFVQDEYLKEQWKNKNQAAIKIGERLVKAMRDDKKGEVYPTDAFSGGEVPTKATITTWIKGIPRYEDQIHSSVNLSS